jgi:hypothetical protein
MTMGVVVNIDLIFISSHRQNVWMKSHFPSHITSLLCIDSGIYSQVSNDVVCK